MENEKSDKVLESMGFGPKTLAMIVGSLFFLMLILFGFIFAGIFAFATPGGFSASINSIFPMLAGGGSSQASGGPEGDNAEMGTLLEEKLEAVSKEDDIDE